MFGCLFVYAFVYLCVSVFLRGCLFVDLVGRLFACSFMCVCVCVCVCLFVCG